MKRDDGGMHSSRPQEAYPAVTIVIPTYNRAHLVSNAIESALGQAYPNLQVVVVDDGSTDDTTAVLRSYRAHPRVRVIVRPVNGGVMAAKNTGLESLEESTVYFGILDSDDTLEPDAVSKLVGIFGADDQPLSQVFGWCVDADTGEPTGIAPHGEGLITYQDAICGRFAGEFWQLVRNDLLPSLDEPLFDERAGGNEAMLWWPLMDLAPAYLVDSVVRRYDRSGADRINRPAFTKRGAEQKMWGYHAVLRRTGADITAVCPESFVHLALEEGKWAALAGHKGKALAAIKAATRRSLSLRALKVSLLLLAPSALLRWLYAKLYGHAR